MKKGIFVVLLAVSLLNGGVFDFMTLEKAREAYAKGEYEKAAKLYEKIAANGSDEAKFNAADALYKAGDYAAALRLYEGVNKKSLEFEKYHNIGNTYALLGKIDEAIEAYRRALKIREDPDTRYNLKLLEEMKRKKERNKKDRNRNSEKENRNQKESSKNTKEKGEQKENAEEEKGSSGKREKEQKESENMESKKSGRKEKEEKMREKDSKSKKENADEKEKMMNAEAKEEPISDMELRKWNEELNRRGIHTLMLPLPTKERKGGVDEIGEW